jgi:hypothetical protein
MCLGRVEKMKKNSCGFMYGELTDKETVARLEYALEHQQHEQFEILLYKKNSKYRRQCHFNKQEYLDVPFSQLNI